MNVNEEPFESLAKGLNRDLSSLFGAGELSARAQDLRTVVDPMLGLTGLSHKATNQTREISTNPAFEPLSDRLAQQIVVFPRADRVVVNEFGAYIPKSLLQKDTDFSFSDEKKRVDVKVSIHVSNKTVNRLNVVRYEARRWQDIPASDSIYDIGRNPITLDVTDASENLDRYIYGGE